MFSHLLAQGSESVAGGLSHILLNWLLADKLGSDFANFTNYHHLILSYHLLLQTQILARYAYR